MQSLKQSPKIEICFKIELSVEYSFLGRELYVVEFRGAFECSKWYFHSVGQNEILAHTKLA